MNLNNISTEDLDRANSSVNHSDYLDGFDGGGGSDMSDFGFDDLNMDDLFGGESSGGISFDSSGGPSSFGDSSGGFGGGSSGFGSSTGFGGNNGFGGGSSFGSQSGGFGGSSFGGGNSFGGGFGGGFGDSSGGFGGGSSFGQQGAFNSPFGTPGPQQQQAVQPSRMDMALDIGVETTKNIGAILLEMIKSFKLRTSDDIGYFSRNLIIGGGAMVPAGILLGLVGIATEIKALSFHGLGTQSLLAGFLTASIGLVGIGISSMLLDRMEADMPNTEDLIPDEPVGTDNFINDLEENAGGIADDLFGDDFDSFFDSDFGDELDTVAADEPEDIFQPDMGNTDEINFDELYAQVDENAAITREKLFNTFVGMFKRNTLDFDKRVELDSSDSDFLKLQAVCLKAASRVIGCDMEEIGSALHSVIDTLFSYELKFERVSKLKNLEAFAREIEVYVRDGAEDTATTANVVLEGDYYRIIITKGISKIVTFGDIFKLQKCRDFFLDEGNKLPMITGITDLGDVILDDAKMFDTMLIAGKPRSGKSWYVLSILMSLMLFNSPEDVQFLIIDPKESNLFKTISLMPHVMGLHNDEHILSILDDIITVEGERRKELLKKHRCDDIWALRKKGIKLDVLYIVLDEYITVINNLDKDEKKEFDQKFQVLISQLPFVGIRLLFVPHRATGIVDKTNRSMIQFTCAVRSNAEDVKDTLDIPKWSRSLTRPGDMAIKTSNMTDAKFAKGAALSIDDGDNTIFIENAAKVMYKMGVPIPDYRRLRIACNRDEEYIKSELKSDSNIVQYTVDNIDDDLDSL